METRETTQRFKVWPVRNRFLASTSGKSQPPKTPAQGVLGSFLASKGSCTNVYLSSHRHTCIHIIKVKTHLKSKTKGLLNCSNYAPSFMYSRCRRVNRNLSRSLLYTKLTWGKKRAANCVNKVQSSLHSL